MALVNMADMLRHAYQHNYAIPAFDLVSLDFLAAIMRTAELKQSPVILSLAESHFGYFDFELAMPAVEAAARRSNVPVAIHLDHGSSLASAVRGINLGCNGVMVDASTLPFDENVKRTAEVAAMAHGCGVTVEAELGYVAGVEGEDAERHPGEVIYTAPDDARRFVEQTGVDCLAVSIGTVHGRMRGEPRLDFDRLAEINRTVGIPLVIHGGTGLSDDQFSQLIANGVTKINYYTALADAAGQRIRNNATAGGKGYTQLVAGIQDAMGAEMARCIDVWGSADRAADLLACCTPWQPVEHTIIYNLDEAADVTALMAEGRRVLSRIPGVREVFTGRALQEDARYRFSWNLRFCHPAVVDSYRDHPEHLAFANNCFRPVAGDRISIDFQGDIAVID